MASSCNQTARDIVCERGAAGAVAAHRAGLTFRGNGLIMYLLPFDFLAQCFFYSQPNKLNGCTTPRLVRLSELTETLPESQTVAHKFGAFLFSPERSEMKYTKTTAEARKLRRLLMHRQQGKCLECGVFEWQDIKRTFDIHRLDKNGPYIPENCVLLCRQCHHKHHHGNGKNRQ